LATKIVTQKKQPHRRRFVELACGKTSGKTLPDIMSEMHTPKVLQPAPVTQPAAPAERPASPAREIQGGDSPWGAIWRVLGARYRSMSDQASRRILQRTLKIGVSARIFHPESGATGLRSKTLQYLEESIAQWVMSRDVLVFMIPTVNTGGSLRPSSIKLRDYAKHLDGLVLQGGADVAPQSYSQSPTRPEWSGDRARDMYELELLHEFVEAGKPVLGICRGCQLINVAFGGSLYQDIASDLPSAIEHVNDLYDSHRHVIHFPEGSLLGGLFKSQPAPLVNSIHHQAVKDLGRDLSVEAVSGDDNVIEAIRYRKARFVMGLQWHPEFHRHGGELLDCTPILDSFLSAARETRF
jgi:putative glutamine amidotransferase